MTRHLKLTSFSQFNLSTKLICACLYYSGSLLVHTCTVSVCMTTMTHSNDNHGSVWSDGSLTSGPMLSDTLLPSHIRGCQYTQLQCVCGGGVCDWDVCGVGEENIMWIECVCSLGTHVMGGMCVCVMGVCVGGGCVVGVLQCVVQY